MLLVHLRAFSLLILLIFSLDIFAEENKKLTQLFVEKAIHLKLNKNVEWQKILFYQKKYFSTKRGIVDGEKFYLSENGRKSPKDEMSATIESLFSGKEGDNSAQCLFPRRLKWLRQKLETDELKIPVVYCPKLNQWLENVNPKGVALIFSSFYLNNPSSMFGHTFLRIVNSSYSLTDYGVNYAANSNSKNMVLYALNGLFGKFEGKFSLMPYSVKVQEYNNSESRDIYEYELNITQDQTLNLMLSLWEVGDNPINYYYVDENCSYVLLALLDAANPQFNFIDKFMLFVNPADTLRVVNAFPDLVKKVTIRPSSERRFKQRYQILKSEEKKLFSKILDQKHESLLLENLTSIVSKESAAKILTAASEYIDYKMHVAGSGDFKKYPEKREFILKARAELGIITPPFNLNINKDEFPHSGVYGSRIGTSYSYSSVAKSGLNIELRPVLHDIEDPSQGYSKEAQIDLLKTVLSYSFHSKSLYIKELSLINILSLPSFNAPLYPISWGVQLALKQDSDCQVNLNSSHCNRYLLSGLSGYSFSEGIFQAYLLPNLQMSYMDNFGFENLLGGRTGILIRPNDKISYSISGEFLKRYSVTQSVWRNHAYVEASLSFSFLKQMESRLNISYNQQTSNWTFNAGLHYYFF